MTKNKNSTRYYSGRQERAVAKALNGRTVANSGAATFVGGDVIIENWLIECKTSVSEKKSFSIKKQWLEKNAEEAFAMGKEYNALCFDFGDNGNRYYVVDEKAFLKLKDVIWSEPI